MSFEMKKKIKQKCEATLKSNRSFHRALRPNAKARVSLYSKIIIIQDSFHELLFPRHCAISHLALHL